MFAIAAEQHTRGVELIELDTTSSPARLRAVRSTSEPNAVLGAEPIAVESAEYTFDQPVADRLLVRVRFALAANPLPLDDSSMGPAWRVKLPTVPSSTPFYAFVLERPAGPPVVRSFSSKLTPDTARVCAALAEAWKELAVSRAELTPEPTPSVSDLVARAWKAGAGEAAWLRQRVLALSAALPHAELIPFILPSLNAEHATATLAVNALAAASGKDLRRDAAGGLRPLAEIVRDYQELFAATVATGQAHDRSSTRSP